MTLLERVLIPVAALLLALAVAAGVYQTLTAGPFTINDHMPLPIVIAQLGIRVGPTLVTIALACIAGLLFLRAARWRP